MKKEVNDRAKGNWSKIRNAIFGNASNPDDSTFKLDPSGYHSNRTREDLVLHHGIDEIANYRIAYAGNHVSIKTVHINKNEHSYLISFTDGNLCHLNLNNLKQQVFHCHEPVYSITIAEKYRTYVALCRDSSIRILNEDFSLVNTISYTGVYTGLVYNSFKNEIITYGIGQINVWSFRTVGKLLIPGRMISENLQPNDCISHISIEKTVSENQRCFAAVSNEIFVYILSTGKCLYHIKDSHNCIITSIMYYKPLQILVTGAIDGSIKTWNEKSLNCLFIGHTAPVTSLAEFPYGPAVMSSSTDGTIRTWNLDTKDEMHCQQLQTSVFGLICQLGDKVFFSYSKQHIRSWRMNTLHSPFSVLRSKPKMLYSTKYQLVPSISCVVCDDSCVRIICPISGEIVTVFISPGYTTINDVVCIASEALLFALLIDGRIIKASFKTNPCTVIKEWNKLTTCSPSPMSCITLFEYHGPKENLGIETNEKDNIDKKLVIGGCDEGRIVLFNWNDDKKAGKIIFTLQAHRKKVLCMAVNTILNQLASASQDLTLKVWRVFPFASEVLVPLLMFIHTMPATHIGFSHHSLCAIYQNISSSLYAFTVYKTKNVKKANQLEHHICNDHYDVITCFDACPRMHIFATGSMDCTVRVWSVENCLIRILKLNDVPTSLAFCSQRGDLLLGIGTNINYVSHKSYLPRSYLYQMVAMSFMDGKEIPPIPVDRTRGELSPLDANRLFKAHSSFIKFMTFTDEIPFDEQRRKEDEQSKKEEECSILKARDEELELIKEGKLKATRKCKINSKDLKEEAFHKYLDLFYTRPNISYPTDDDNCMDFNVNVDDSFAVKIDSYPSFQQPCDNKFFAIQANNFDIKNLKSKLRKEYYDKCIHRTKLLGLKKELPIVKEKRSLSIVTNNVEGEDEVPRLRPTLSASTTYTDRLRALQNVRKHPDQWRDDFSFSKEKLEQYDAAALGEYPLSDNVIRNINKQIISRLEHSGFRHEPSRDVLPIAPDGYLPNSVVIALYTELRKESTPKEIRKWKPRALNTDQLKKKVKEYRTPMPSSHPKTPEAKLSLIMKSFSEEKSEISSSDEEIIDIVTPPPTRKKSSIQKYPSIEKDISVISIPSPRASTPIPSFVLQFKDLEWFRTCFPILNSQTLGKPCTIESFVRLLLNKLEEIPEYDIKTEITTAILLLSQQMPFDKELKDLVRKCLLNELNLPGGRPNSKNSKMELRFIKNAVRGLLEIDTLSMMVVVEMMVQYILGDSVFRKEIMKTFSDLGLQDPKEYFLCELITKFNIADAKDPSKKRKLRNSCFEWLINWSEKLKQHITSLSGKLCRTSKPAATNAKELKNLFKDNMKTRSSGSKEITFVSDAFVRNAASHASPIDAINYFCEHKFNEDLAMLKAGRKNSKCKTNKNTVLFTDKKDTYVSLARIGETHESKCHPERETSLHRGESLQPTTNNVIRGLMLHAKKVTLAPFPDELDRLFYAPNAQSTLITLQYAQKYFIPSKSFVL